MESLTPFDRLKHSVEIVDLPRGSRIVVAVSGGPDSVALLAALHDVSADPAFAYDLLIVHVNHSLREEESDQDEEFVRGLGEQFDIPVEAVSVDTYSFARSRHMSVEAAARELRYRALREALAAWKGHFIAVAHTEDDQAETLLLRLLRGTGLTGLGGMRERSGEIVRPFLKLRRDAIIAALIERELEYRFDSSNLDTYHLRNRVRLEVVRPLLEVQPHAIELLARTARLTQTDADYLRQDATRAVDLLVAEHTSSQIQGSAGAWRSLHPALQGEVVRLLLELLLGDTRDMDQAHVELISELLQHDDASAEDQLPRGVRVHVEAGRFTFSTGPQEQKIPLATLPLAVPGITDLRTGTIQAEIIQSPDEKELYHLLGVTGTYHALCDLTDTGTELRVRSRHPGDRMRPLGAPGTRKLQDLFVDHHVPRDLRDLVPVIENDNHIVWIAGIALDQQSAIGPTSRDILHLVYRPRRPRRSW